MPMSPSTRYVILDWPQAGSRPELADTVAYDNLIDAQDAATDLNTEAKRDNRPNAFTVHAVDMEAMDR